VEKKLAHFTVCHFGAKKSDTIIKFKAVHNVKTKSSGIILTPWAMFAPISAFLPTLFSEVVCGEECAHFSTIFANFTIIIKLFSKTQSVRIILTLDTTSVPNLTILGLLSPEVSFGEKTVTHPDTQLILPPAITVYSQHSNRLS